jgi:hypothetical protein
MMALRKIALRLLTPALAAGCGAAAVAAGASAFMEFVMLAAACLVAAVAALIVVKRKRHDAASPITLITVFYGLGFAAGAIYAWPRLSEASMHFSRAELILALGLGALAWLMTLVGYALSPFGRLMRALPTWEPSACNPLAIAVALSALGWLARWQLARSGHYFHTVRSGSASVHVSWLISSVASLPTLAAAIVGASAKMEPRYRRLRKLYWALLSAEVAWYVPTGERGALIGLGLTALLVEYYGARKRVPVLGLFLAAGIAMFIVLPIGLAYRGEDTKYQQHPAQSLSQAYRNWSSQSLGQVLSRGADATFSRFSDAASVAVILDQGRGRLERRPGDTFMWSLEGLVPRSILPNKPDPGVFGNEFGRKFGVLSPNDRITSIAVTTVGESYLAFGVLGVLLVMPLCGVIYRALDALFDARDRNSSVLAIYSVVAWPLVQSPGTIFALGLMGVMKLTSFYILIFFLADAARRVLHRSDSSIREVALSRGSSGATL